MLTSSHFTVLSAHAAFTGWAGRWLAGLAGCPNMCFLCGIRRVTTSNPMEMRILRTFSPLWLKVRLECGKMRGTLKILLTSSHFTALSAHGLAGLGWAGWAGLAGWAGWAGWARWAGWLAG